MNKEVTIYELLGLVKDNKAPQKIRFRDSLWIYSERDQDYLKQNNEHNLFGYAFNCWRTSDFINDKVKILEEDKDIEEITSGELCSRSYTNEQLRSDVDVLRDKINEVIREVNKLLKENE